MVGLGSAYTLAANDKGIIVPALAELRALGAPADAQPLGQELPMFMCTEMTKDGAKGSGRRSTLLRRPITSYCSWCLLLVLRRSQYTQQRTSFHCLSPSPALYSPSKFTPQPPSKGPVVPLYMSYADCAAAVAETGRRPKPPSATSLAGVVEDEPNGAFSFVPPSASMEHITRYVGKGVYWRPVKDL